jgi:dienelactone hydrolase
MTARYRATKPLLSFDARTRNQWRAWRRRFLAALKKCLGPTPEKVPLRTQVLERRVFPTYVREKIVFDSEKFMSVPAWVCSPRRRKRGERFPAVLCAHGHGLGKNPLVGLDNKGRPCKSYGKRIAVQLAERGYVTIAPDWRAFGERAEAQELSRDPHLCNSVGLSMLKFGYILLNLDVWDAMRCVDYLIGRSDVISDKIGCVGCSFGGRMTTYIAALDERIAAACINGFLEKVSRNKMGGSVIACGGQTIPNLYKYGEEVDVAGLICPRPLLIQAGRYDSVASGKGQARAYRYLKKIYKAAGVPECVELDLFEGVHEINVPALVDFFDRRLKGKERSEGVRP